MSEIVEILESGFSLESITTQISLWGFLATMAVALFCALVIYLVYRFFYPGIIYSANFNLLLVMVTLVTALIILTISANIILSLGMVGALSIVRFRSAVKDPLDIGFLFLGIGAGLTAGAGLYLIATCGTVFISLVYILVLLAKRERQNHLLIVVYQADAEGFVKESVEALSGKIKNKTVTRSGSEITAEIKVKRGDTSFLETLLGNALVESASLVEFNTDNAV